jgi:glycosyltransferase involved in cell wall biosynthesis
VPLLASPCILVVLDSLAAEGTPRLVLELCRIWQRNGIRPVIALLRPSPDDLAPEFNALGLERVDLPMSDRGYARYLRLMIASFKLARRFRPEAVLSMPLGWHAFIAWGMKLAGVPRVAAHVGTYPWHWQGLAFRKFRLEIQLGDPVTDCLICCSEYVQAGVLRWFGTDKSKTTVIWNGVDGTKFAAASISAVRESCRSGWRAGMLGRIDLTKDYRTLILAGHELNKRRRPIELWLIGDGSGRAELESLIAQCGLGEHVRFLGVRRDVPAILAQLDAFLFAARREEGLGIALIEAMAAGVPVVASDVGACREVLDDGALGLLVPPGDPVALADAIERLRAEPEAAAARAERARRKAFEVFDAERMAAAYAKVLGLKTDSAAAALQAA